MAARQAARVLAAAVGFGSAVAGSAIINATLLASDYTDFPARQRMQVEEDPLARSVLRDVTILYKDGHMSDAFSPTVVFEDPVALVAGRGRVQEAFRALRAFAPDVAATRIESTEGGSEVALSLLVRYSAFGVLPFSVTSRVIVGLDGHGQIARVEEQWNAQPLIGLQPWVATRQVAGHVSDALTRLII
jgi:hypothetical protein